MRLIIINPDTKLPEPSPESLLIPEFSELWTRKNRIDGDPIGIKKTRNLQEFGFVYYNGVWDNRWKYLEPDVAEKDIKKLLKLPDEWKPDKVVSDCLEIFRDTQQTPSLELFDSINGANADLAKWIKLKRAGLKDGRAEVADVNKILDIIERAPKVIEHINKSEQVLQKEQDAMARGKKGRKIGLFEVPPQMTAS